MKLHDWLMRDTLISGDYAGAAALLRAHFELDLHIDRIEIQGPETWGVEWGIEIIAGPHWNKCYAWFETDSFWSIAVKKRYSGSVKPPDNSIPVRAVVWQGPR
jgi:hypothetical protein